LVALRFTPSHRRRTRRRHPKNPTVDLVFFCTHNSRHHDSRSRIRWLVVLVLVRSVFPRRPVVGCPPRAHRTVVSAASKGRATHRWRNHYYCRTSRCRHHCSFFVVVVCCRRLRPCRTGLLWDDNDGAPPVVVGIEPWFGSGSAHNEDDPLLLLLLPHGCGSIAMESPQWCDATTPNVSCVSPRRRWARMPPPPRFPLWTRRRE
jgi:hypothetical protein